MTQETNQSTPDKPPAVSPPRRNIGRRIGFVVAAILVIAMIAAAIYGLVSNPAGGLTVTGILRDISIIVLSLTTVVIGIFLAVLIFQVQSLIALLRDEIKPIIESANQTVSTVRGTTTFLSDTVVNPMITAASYVSAIRQTAKVLVGGGRKKPDGSKPDGEPGVS